MAGDVSFAITLQDDVSPAAQSAAASLQQTVSALQQTDSAAGALAGGQTRAAASMRASGSAADGAARNVTRLNAAEAKSSGDALAGEERNAARAMTEAGRAAEGASGKVEKLAKAQGKTKDAAAQSGQGFAQMGGLLKGAFPQLGGMVEQSGNLAKGLGGIPPMAALAAVAVAALAAAIAAAAYKLVSFGIGVADAAQHMRAMSVGMAGSVAEGDKLNATIGSVARTNVVAADKVSEFAKELIEAKITGAEMRSALDAAAKSSRLMGDQAGSAFVKSAIEAKKAGKSITELSDTARKKLGPGLAIEMQRPSVALERLKETASSLFAGVDVSGFAKGLDKITASLEEGQAVGDAWRALFASLFGGLGENASSAGDLARAVLEEITIAALKVAIAVKPVARRVSEMFEAFSKGDDDAKGFISTGNAIAGFLESIGAALVVVGGAAAVSLSITRALWSVIGGAISLLVSAASAVYDFAASFSFGGALSAVTGFVGSVVDGLGSLVTGAASIAGDFIAGLVGGIANGAGLVIDAVKGLAGSVINAAKSALGIASPSKVMLGIGGYTAEGFAGGLDAGAAMVESSATALAQAPVQAAEAIGPAAAAPARTSAPAASGGAGARVDVGGVTITISGVAGAENILERLPAAIADAFEQVAESLGLNPSEA